MKTGYIFILFLLALISCKEKRKESVWEGAKQGYSIYTSEILIDWELANHHEGFLRSLAYSRSKIQMSPGG